MKLSHIICWQVVAVAAVPALQALFPRDASNIQNSTLDADAARELSAPNTKFPAGRFPPRRTAGFKDFIYDIYDANPPTRLAFRPVSTNLWRRDRNGEEDVNAALLQAMRDASTAQPDLPLDPREWKWTVGSAAKQELVLNPFRPRQSRSPVMTWEQWRTVLVALQGFVVAYPGVNVHFQIYWMEYQSYGDVEVGTGAVQNTGNSQAVSETTCDHLDQGCGNPTGDSNDGTLVEVS